MRVFFQEVALYSEKAGKCGCGKRRTRRKRFYQTLNPWNKNEAGNPKSRDEIRTEIMTEIQQWKQQPIMCDGCDSSARS